MIVQGEKQGKEVVQLETSFNLALRGSLEFDCPT